jgi:hypothetical protein
VCQKALECFYTCNETFVQLFYCQSCFSVLATSNHSRDNETRACKYYQAVIEYVSKLKSTLPMQILIYGVEEIPTALATFDKAIITTCATELIECEVVFDVVIVAPCVFDHVKDPIDWLRKFGNVCSFNGTVLLENTPHPDIFCAVSNNMYFYSTNGIIQLCQRANMTLCDVIKYEGVHLYEIMKGPNKNVKCNVPEVLYEEMTRGVYDECHYKTYQWNCQLYKNTLQNILIYAKLKNVKIIGLREHCHLFANMYDTLVDNVQQLQNVLSEQTYPFEYLLVWPCNISIEHQKAFYILNTKTLEVT